MNTGTSNSGLRKLLMMIAGAMLAYAGFSLVTTINANPAPNTLGVVGQVIGAIMIIYGALVVIGYLYSLVSGRSRPGFSRVPFIPRTSDPGITKDDRIKALEALRQQGLLTQEQFEKKRSDILSQRW
jgi:L-asparagine transporter-like permease